MINELICRSFASRNHAHLQHWKTKSYAEHMALGSFYDGVVDKIDAYIEAYQAAFGLVDFEEDEKLDEKLEEISDIRAHLQDDVKWINKNRTDLAREVPALENILDDLVGLYLSTIYKLKFLS